MEQQIQLDSLSTTVIELVKNVNDKFANITNQMSTMMEMLTRLEDNVKILDKRVETLEISNIKEKQENIEVIDKVILIPPTYNQNYNQNRQQKQNYNKYNKQKHYNQHYNKNYNQNKQQKQTKQPFDISFPYNFANMN